MRQEENPIAEMVGTIENALTVVAVAIISSKWRAPTKPVDCSREIGVFANSVDALGIDTRTEIASSRYKDAPILALIILPIKAVAKRN